MTTTSATPEWAQLTMSPDECARERSRFRRHALKPIIGFLGPFLFLWTLFLAVPMGWATWLSFNEGGLVSDAKFVGFKNWTTFLNNDELRTAIKNTSVYVVVAITVVFGLGLILAALLNNNKKSQNFFKVALYFPLLIPPIMAGMIFFFLTHYDMGVINLLLQTAGQDRVNFLGANPNALMTIAGLEVWRGLGFWVLFYLAGLQSVPTDLIDAGKIDGARNTRRFLRISLPTLRPLMLFALVIALIFNFQLFDSVQALTKGGPTLGTTSIVWFIYKQLFTFQQSGVAYATSLALLLLVVALTIFAYGFLGHRKDGLK
ncbi:MAG: sugar ABC transporter permease [Acidimicrobiia bacterium]|nr:sugar ABC transporter permease [Acidimicrobiia bacterium]